MDDKDDDKKGGDKTKAAAAKAHPDRVDAAQEWPGTFRIKRGEIVNGHFAGVQIRNGFGYTDDPIRAHACLETCEVTDGRTGEPYTGEAPAKAAKKKK